MRRCNHVFVKGERKGEQCKTTVRSAASFCSKHAASHANATMGAEPSHANDVRSNVDDPSPRGRPSDLSDDVQVPVESENDTSTSIIRNQHTDGAPTMTDMVVNTLVSQHTPIVKYGASNPSQIHIKSAPERATATCDITRFMMILESSFQQNATLI